MYDVVIIGCGPGGYAASIRAAQLGASVAVVEAGDIGGTCVNRGCIPSKVWSRAAATLNMIKTGHEFGIDASIHGINLAALIERKNDISAEIRMGMKTLLEANGVDLIRGTGRLKNAREIAVGSKTVAAGKIILATGSRPDIPEIPGLKEALLTTDEIFDMHDIPDSVLVWGEGLVEVEMASLLHTLGSKVCLATQAPRILPDEDHDTSQRLAQAFREQGIQVITRTALEAVKNSGTKFQAVLSGRREQIEEVAKVVISARKPDATGLGLAQAGVGLNEDGTIGVDSMLQTCAEGIYAVGDITGGWMNSHAASAMGVTAAENALGQFNEFPFDLVPRATWTFPQVGAVGLTEEAAEKKGFEVEVGEFPYPVNGLAMSYGEVDGAVKIVMEAESREILGVHIVGANATELVGEAVMALQLECTADELAHTIRVHPTFSEALMDAGRDAAGWALYLPPTNQPPRSKPAV